MLKDLFRIVATIILFKRGFLNRISRQFLRAKFKTCGKNVKFDSLSRFTYQNINIGNDVYIGPNAVFSASNSELTIGNKVLFGPNVTIVIGKQKCSDNGNFNAVKTGTGIQ